MGLLDLFKTKKRNPNKFDFRWSEQFLQFAGITTSANQKDESYIDNGFNKNPTVNAIVGMTQKNAGMVKWGIYTKDKDGTSQPYTEVSLQELMYSPNNMETWNELMQKLIGFKMLTGNAYLWGIPSVNKGMGSLYVLPSQEVKIHVAENQRSIVGYSVDFYGQGDDETIAYDEVMHLRTFNPDYKDTSSFLYGKSPLQAAYRSLQTNNDALDTARAYLLNQGPRGILSMELDDTYGEMTEEQVTELRNRFKRNNTGTKKAGELLVAPGKWRWEDIGSTAADMKLIEHYNLTINDICNVYNFPTLLLGSGESTFSNQKEAKKALWSNVIIPMLTEIRDGLNCWLAPMYGDNIYIDFDLRDIKELQEDINAQANAISKLQNVITINEARAMIGKAPIEGGEEIYRFIQGVEDGKDNDNSESSGSSEVSEDDK